MAEEITKQEADKAPSFDIDSYLDKGNWTNEDWKKITYHYLDNLPDGKDIKEFDMEIAKKMAIDGMSDKRVMSVLQGINRLNHYSGPDVSIDVVNSKEFQEFRKNFPVHLSKKGQEWVEVKAILKKAKMESGDWPKLAYHYNLPKEKYEKVEEHNLAVAKRMAKDGISNGKIKVILGIVNKFNKYEGPDVVPDVIKSKELKEYRESLSKEAAQEQSKKKGKAKAQAR